MSKSDLEGWLKSKSVLVVEWLDAASNDAWSPMKTAAGAQRCISVGILHAADADSISLTHTFAAPDSSEQDVCCSLSIPKSCITAAYEVKAMKLSAVRRKRCKS